MSRIGKVPVEIPSNVKVTINGNAVIVEGPLGKNEKMFDDSITIQIDKDVIHISPADVNNDHSLMMHGTVRSIISAMINGVVNGYKKELEISGVGFKAIIKGDSLDLDLGFSHEILYKIPNGIKIVVDPSGVKLSVSGVDKQLVGQVAANIKSYYPIEPYKGKGVHIIGEYVRRKEGKKTA